MIAIIAILFAYACSWAVVAAWGRVEKRLTEKEIENIRRRIEE